MFFLQINIDPKVYKVIVCNTIIEFYVPQFVKKSKRKVKKMVKVAFKDIISLTSIGLTDNPINMNELLRKANENQLSAASYDKQKVLLLIIDMQNDFMESGSLAVPNSHIDVKNLVSWMYKNIEKITDIAFSLDTHFPFQIFHPSWWVDENGRNPEPFTVITKEDLDNNKWKAVNFQKESYEYVRGLESKGKKKLVIWTYHCLHVTFGNALENQTSNMVYFHSAIRNSTPIRLVKGQDPLSEMYGIIRAEFDPKNNVNTEFLKKLLEYDRIIIAGEAKSHCVSESIKQIIEFFEDTDSKKLNRIFILEDCMSNIPGFEADSEADFKNFKEVHLVNVVKSTNFSL